MASDVLMPKMGYDMTEGRILRWLKQEGEEVERGQPIAEIETDKASIEIQAFTSGKLGQIVANEGEMVPVGQKIAVIVGEGESANGAATASAAPAESAPARETPKQEAPAEEEQPAEQASPQARAEQAAPPAKQAPPAGTEEGRIKASPLARRIAQEHEIDLGQVQGSGPGGRIVRDDVLALVQQQTAPAAAQAPAPAQAPAQPAPVSAPAEGDTTAPLTRMRQTIARRMVESKTSAPHFYVRADVDMTEALAWRKQLNDAAAADNYKITVNDLIVKACGLALRKFPNVNASFGGDTLILHDRVDISIAVPVPDGLIAPVVRNVDQKAIGRIARDAADLIARARDGKLAPDDYSGGTFTVSNLGPYGIEEFSAIITLPQAAALACGASSPQAVVVDGEIVIRDRMRITISADHRVIDGAEAAQFVNEVKRLLEHPLALLM